MIIKLIRQHVQVNKDTKILDAGCGTGLLAQKLQRYGSVIGVDINKAALFYARKRGTNVRRASLERLPFAANTFDIAVSVDVLYHKQIKSDVHALKELCRVLKPGGFLFMRAPAVSWFLRSHDALVETRIRYDKQDLFRKLLLAKFSIVRLTYVHGVLFFIGLAFYLKEKVMKLETPKSDVYRVPGPINSMVLFLLRLERRIFGTIPMPIGLGLVAVAQKKIKACR